MTTKEEIRDWLKTGIQKNATHVIIMCDTFDHEDYPVYISKDQDIKQEYEKRANGTNMQRVMEVYNLSMDIEEQLKEHRAFNL